MQGLHHRGCGIRSTFTLSPIAKCSLCEPSVARARRGVLAAGPVSGVSVAGEGEMSKTTAGVTTRARTRSLARNACRSLS
jgi:hypothetical protein